MLVKRNVLGIVLTLSASMVFAGSAQAQLDSLRKFVRQADASKRIAHFEIKGVVGETPVRLPPLFGSEPRVSLKSLLARFKEARQDENVVAVVVDLQEAALGFGQLEEIHAAMRQFAAVDKDVYVHADALTTLTYAAACGASHISIVPTGELWVTGIYGETPYVRGTLDKIGMVADFEQCGDFKTGLEPLTRTGPSEQSKQMTQWLLDSVYGSLVELMAVGRGMTAEKARTLIDNGPYSAEEALAAGLIDSIKHRQDFRTDLKARYGLGVEFVKDYGEKDGLAMPKDNLWAILEFFGKLLSPSGEVYSKPTVALVYVEGLIVTGKAEMTPFGVTEGAFSTTIRNALDKAADDSSVKAVVLRVDSPGGSALASEIILDATRRVAAKKPLIVSMGNVAGSGGYYVSCGAETIFADKGTITASIGVLGGKLVTTEMWDKLGVNWYPHQRGRMAGMLSSAGRFTDEERAKLRHLIDMIYDVFKQHVVDARGDRLAKPIDEIAAGRVFTGVQALELGLVDKLGGLAEAIRFAAQRAGLGEYDVRVIPDPPTLFDLLVGRFDNDEFAWTTKPARISLLDLPSFRAVLPVLAKIDPLRVRGIVRSLQRIELIHEEGVVMMMPAELLIR